MHMLCMLSMRMLYNMDIGYVCALCFVHVYHCDIFYNVL